MNLTGDLLRCGENDFLQGFQNWRYGNPSGRHCILLCHSKTPGMDNGPRHIPTWMKELEALKERGLETPKHSSWGSAGGSRGSRGAKQNVREWPLQEFDPQALERVFISTRVVLSHARTWHVKCRRNYYLSQQSINQI